MTKYSEKAAAVKEALDATYEGKTNKKTSLDGDYSQDTDSYPTVGAVNAGLATKVTGDDLGLSYNSSTGVLSLTLEPAGPQPYTLNQDPANVISGSITFTDGE